MGTTRGKDAGPLHDREFRQFALTVDCYVLVLKSKQGGQSFSNRKVPNTLNNNGKIVYH